MPTRKTTIKSESGVRLELIEHLNRNQGVESRAYKLRTLRLGQPRLFANDREAEDAFDLELIASLTDPVVQEMVKRGLTD